MKGKILTTAAAGLSLMASLGATESKGEEILRLAREHEQSLRAYATTSSVTSSGGNEMKITKTVVHTTDGSTRSRIEYHSNPRVRSVPVTLTFDRVIIKNGEGDWHILGDKAVKIPQENSQIPDEIFAAAENMRKSTEGAQAAYSVERLKADGRDVLKVIEAYADAVLDQQEKILAKILEARMATAGGIDFSKIRENAIKTIPALTEYWVDEEKNFIVRVIKRNREGAVVSDNVVSSLAFEVPDAEVLTTVPRDLKRILPATRKEYLAVVRQNFKAAEVTTSKPKQTTNPPKK